MKNKQWWLDFLKGTTIGFAIPIPGVSGGTMAILTGIFDKIAQAVSEFRKNFWRSVQTLLPIGLGALLMAIIGFLGIKKGFEFAPFALSALFAGLVLGSTPVVTKELKDTIWTAKPILRLVIGFLVAAGIGIASALVYYFTGFSIASSLASTNWWIYPVLMAAGFIGAAAAVVPGISGSMMMYLMGLYVPVVSLYTTWSNWKDSSLYGVMFGGGVCLIIGGLAGFILTNVWMKDLIAKHHNPTYEVILGFIFGSLIAMFVNPQMIKVNADTQTKYWLYTATPIWEWVVGSLLFIGATIALYLLTKKFQAQTAQAAEIAPKEENK